MKIKKGKAYLCKTEELSKEFLKECEKQGLMWRNNKKPTALNYWRDEERKIYYIIKNDFITYNLDFPTTTCDIIEYKGIVNVIVIKKMGDKVIACSGKKKGVAKCSPEDEFDFYTGAKLALDRLFDKGVREVKRPAKVGEYVKILNSDYEGFEDKGKIFKVSATYGDVIGIHWTDVDAALSPGGDGCYCYMLDAYVVLENYKPENEVKEKPVEKEKFVPHLMSGSEHYGVIGTPTKYKDAIGRPLVVGDTVEHFDYTNKSYGETAIVETEEDGQFVMGICAHCDGKTGEIKCGWKIIKKRDHTEVKDGEDVYEMARIPIKYIKAEKQVRKE